MQGSLPLHRALEVLASPQAGGEGEDRQIGKEERKPSPLAEDWTAL